ncbi:spore germination protein [Paenibacillus sp. LMG 31459]|jgi:spore germination protein KA|uniref:Spore germination protein n=1 Tax=Paenibacillus phytohabitans TaxID=2654978 RepID=A0ABX1YCM3_9BACL|nr:spore germination protein [Paenibacillus phytohabitans]NOU78129.1 spore germination protein [Paenibacillus phytohabitans]
MKFHDQESRKPHDPHLQRLSREAFINTELICHRLGASSDVSVRSIRLDWSSLERECVIQLIFLDGMVNSQVLQESIIPAIQSAPPVPEGYSLPRYFSDQILTAGQVRITGDMTGAVKDILSGCLLMLIDGYDEALALAIQGYEKRSIGETKTETVIRGPQEAFTDDLRTNITMIRRKMKDERLRIVTRSVGQVTQTDVSILYIEGLADEPVLDRIAEMFDEIGLKMVLEGEYIEEYLQGNKYTVFPTILNTERPDSITAGLAEGRVAIIVDGTPFAMIVPSLFIDFIQSAEDSYQPYLFSSLVRVLRLAAVIISVFAPGLYIAITTFHQDLLPTRLLLSIMFQREGVPFPAFVEATLMEITFEIIREAGIRMPRNIGQAVSIVGTLIVGQAAVDAGIVSAGMVIVVAITGISSFVIPAYNMSISIRMIRFLFMGAAASFGIYGITVGFLILVVHLCSLQSVGIPYMRPYAPYLRKEQADGVFRSPYWSSPRNKRSKDGV